MSRQKIAIIGDDKTERIKKLFDEMKTFVKENCIETKITGSTNIFTNEEIEIAKNINRQFVDYPDKLK